MFYGHHVGTHSGGKLYKKEILLQYPYPEGMIYEDLAVVMNILLVVRKLQLRS